MRLHLRSSRLLPTEPWRATSAHKLGRARRLVRAPFLLCSEHVSHFEARLLSLPCLPRLHSLFDHRLAAHQHRTLLIDISLLSRSLRCVPFQLVLGDRTQRERVLPFCSFQSTPQLRPCSFEIRRVRLLIRVVPSIRCLSYIHEGKSPPARTLQLSLPRHRDGLILLIF